MELRCSNIGYTYKGKKLLNNLSFVMDSSKINGVMGHNKTLLLELIDLQKRYHGDIYIDGTLVRSDNRQDFQRRISLVSQGASFYTSSVEEEMKFIMDYNHYQPKDLRKRMLDSLKMVGLSSNYLTRKVRTLSNVEKILVKLACSFITNPDIILIDEVFVGLDYNNKVIIFFQRKFKIYVRRRGMEKEILIEGMSCSHCSESVKKALSKIEGVKEVNVDLNKKIAVVDADNVDDDVLAGAVNDAGFEAVNITEH